MGSANKVTHWERRRIVKLLKHHQPLQVSFLAGRSVRTIYYIQAEERQRNAGRIYYRLFTKLKELVKGVGNHGEKEVIASRTRKARRA